jgi:hypothetical protein
MNTFITKLATVFLVLFVLLFACYQAYRSLREGYRTETAYEFQIARYCNTEGLLVRTEKPIQANPQGQVRYLLEEGEKLRSDTPIAQVFASQEEAEEAARQEVIREERDLLAALEKSTDTTKTADVESLNKEIALSLRKLTKSAGEKDMEEVADLHMTLVEKISRQQLVTGKNTGFGERIQELDSQLTGNTGGTNIYSSQVGYFSRYVDGYEEKYTPEMLDNLDVAGLRALLEQDYPTDPDAFGKSVTDFNWYYTTVIPAESAEFFSVGTWLDMTFIGSSEQAVEGKVVQMRQDESGDALVVIKSNCITGDVVSRRTASVRLSFRDYSGLRISKNALRIVDGQKGVYVESGYSVQFKKVDIIYTGTDYYLCRTQYNSTDQLNLFDEVIVEGTDLYDGKPLNS